jgi:rod shape determining protein RodA
MLLAVLVIGSDNGHGNKSWINIPGIGIDVQPSEFVKIIFICTFAKHIDLHKNDINKITNVLKLALHALIIVGCVLLSGDLGSALVFIAIVVVMLFCSGLSLWYFAAVAAIIVIVSPLIWSFLKDYQQTRIIVGFNPDMDPENWGYQQIMSRNAIVAGGFRGAGLFGGSSFVHIPSAQSDFIFAVLCEKLGFIGAFIYLALNATLTVRLIWLARGARKDYGALICAGVAALFMAQTLENIGMCLAVLPVVGITLPFMSYGGSSVLSLFICLGLIMSISTHNKKYYFERERS